MRALGPSIAVALLLAAPSPARAEDWAPVRASFAWERGAAAPACPDEAAVAASVEAIAGRSLFTDEPDPDLAVRARIDAIARGHRVRIALLGRGGASVGERVLELEEPGCAVLESVALVIALMLDLPEDVVRRLRARPPPPAAGVPIGAVFALGGGVLPGLLPPPAPSVDLAAGVRIARLVRLELAAHGLPPMRAGDGVGAVELSALAGSLAACVALFEADPFTLEGCAAGWGGAIHAQGRDLPRVRSTWRPLAALAASVRARLRIAGPLGARLEAGVLVPILRDRFGYSPDGATDVALFRAWPALPAIAVSFDLEVPNS